MAANEPAKTAPPGDGWGPASKHVAANLARVREQRGLSTTRLSALLGDIGQPIPATGITRIEKRQRRVDVDDLLALAVVLGVAPVDLLVPASSSDDEPYEVARNLATTAGVAREWISGCWFLTEPESTVEVADSVRLMPKQRASKIMKRWWTPEREMEQNRALNRQLRDEQEGEAREQSGGTP